jgi:hypothetical protein
MLKALLRFDISTLNDLLYFAEGFTITEELETLFID